MDQRVARCLLIAKVLAADGMITDSERAHLEETMEALGLDPDARARVRNFEGWDEAEAVIAALSIEEKRAVMDGLLSAALVDGKISPHERAVIEQLSSSLGIA
jgi:tellurite resistance protein